MLSEWRYDRKKSRTTEQIERSREGVEEGMEDLEEMFDDDGDDLHEEDWTDTSWAQPNTHYPTDVSPGGRNKLEQMKTQIKSDLTVKESEDEDPSVVKRMLLNDHKAGMEGLDKQRINQIIHEASKGSRFYENERKKEEEMKKKIEEQKKKIDLISEAQLKQGLLEADRLLEDFEQQRDLTRTIVHIDMDAFYAAVEMRDNPSLKNKPMAVGGNSMLSTSNYHARKFGVRAAMPGFIAKKLCPELIIVPANFEAYSSASKQVKALIAEYDPNFCPLSLDEAYLDITEHLITRKELSVEERTFICRNEKFVHSEDHCLCDLNDVLKQSGDSLVNVNEDRSVTVKSYLLERIGETVKDEDQELLPLCPVCGRKFPPFYQVTFGLSDEDTVRELRTRIEQRTRLTASAGIAPNMMLSKVCSDKNKPNGQYKIPATRNAVMEFVKDLSTRKISGIGKVSEAMLNAVGVYTCTDLYNKRALLYHLYSQISFNYFMRICLGIGSTTVERDSERKSISTERTFQELSKPADLFQKCEELTDALVEDLKEENLKGKTVSIKIKTVKFEVKTRAHSLPNYTNDREIILQTAIDLLKTEILACSPQPLRLRLMGVRMSGLANQSICKDKRQGTILGAFKKLAEKPKPVQKAEAIDMLEEIVKDEAIEKHTFTSGNSLTLSCNTEEMGTTVDRGSFELASVVIASQGNEVKEMNNNDKIGEPTTGTEQTVGASEHVKVDKSLEDYMVASRQMKMDEYSEDEKGTPEQVKEDESSTDKKIGINSENGDNSVEGDVVNLKREEQQNTTIEKNVIVPSNETLNYTTNTGEVMMNEKEGRRNRSGLVRSNKKPAGKRRNGKPEKCIVYTCPICAKEIPCGSLNEFNEHVDECLDGNSSLCSTNINNVETNDKMENRANNKVETIHGNTENKYLDNSISPVTKTCSSDQDQNPVKNSLHQHSKQNGENIEEKDHTVLGKIINISFKENRIKYSSSSNDINNISADSDRSEREKVKSNEVKFVENTSDLVITELGTATQTTVISLPVITEANDRNTYDGGNKTPGKKSEVNSHKSTEWERTHGTMAENCINERNNINNVENIDPTIPSLPISTGLCPNSLVIENDLSKFCDTKHNNDVTKDITILDDSGVTLNTNKSKVEIQEVIKDQQANGKHTYLGDLDGEYSDSADLKQVSSEQDDSIDLRQGTSEDSGTSDPSQTDLQNLVKESVVENRAVSNCPVTEGCVSKNIWQPKAGCSWMTDNETDGINACTAAYIDRYDDITKTIPTSNADEGNDITNTTTTTMLDDYDDGNVFTLTTTTTCHDDDRDESGLLVCPVCNVEQRSADLSEFNSHVDSCLSRGAISQILKEQRGMNEKTLKRGRELVKTPGSVPPAKKRKTIMPNKSPSCKSILAFFKDSQAI